MFNMNSFYLRRWCKMILKKRDFLDTFLILCSACKLKIPLAALCGQEGFVSLYCTTVQKRFPCNVQVPKIKHDHIQKVLTTIILDPEVSRGFTMQHFLSLKRQVLLLPTNHWSVQESRPWPSRATVTDAWRNKPDYPGDEILDCLIQSQESFYPWQQDCRYPTYTPPALSPSQHLFMSAAPRVWPG